jgi:Tfp pilus assembly protein PilN
LINPQHTAGRHCLPTLQAVQRKRRRANRIAIFLIVVSLGIAIFIGLASGTNSSQVRRREASGTVLQAATEQAAKEQAAKDQAALDAARSAQAAAEAARQAADEAASQAKLEAEENEVKAATG